MMSRAVFALAFVVVLLAPLGAITKRYRYYEDRGVLATRVDRWTGKVAARECVEVLPPGMAVPSTLPSSPREANPAGHAPADSARLSGPSSRRCSWNDRPP